MIHFKEMKTPTMKLIISILFIGLVNESFSQITLKGLTCNEVKDSVYLASDTMYIDQTTDTTISPGFQWMGYTDLSYLPLGIAYNDSSLIKLSGGTVTGGLFSPYPYPFPISVDIEYLQSSIPQNTVINAHISVAQGFCNVPITFIINPSSVSVPEIKKPDLELRIFPNPMTSSSTLEFSDNLKSTYNITIYNTAAEVIHSAENLSDKSYRLNRSYFQSPGIYFVEIQSINMKSKLIKLLVE